MQTIGEAAKNQAITVNGSEVEKDIERFQSINDFKAGVKFAQTWIDVNEELPELDVDSHRISIDVLLQDENGTCFVGYYDHELELFCSLETNKILTNIIKWRPIELK